MVVAGKVGAMEEGVMEEEAEDAGMEVNVTDEVVEGAVIVVTVVIVVIVTVGGVEQEVEEVVEEMVSYSTPMLSRHCKSDIRLSVMIR